MHMIEVYKIGLTETTELDKIKIQVLIQAYFCLTKAVLPKVTQDLMV